LNIQTIKIEEINPAKYNPRFISPEAIEGLERSLEQFGYVEPIVWNKRSKNVVGGHQRLKVLQKQGKKEVQVVVVDLDNTQEKALNITLNNKSIQGEFEPFKLKELLQELKIDLPEYEELKLDNLEISAPEELLEEEKENNKEDMQKFKNKCPNCGQKLNVDLVFK